MSDANTNAAPGQVIALDAMRKAASAAAKDDPNTFWAEMEVLRARFVELGVLDAKDQKRLNGLEQLYAEAVFRYRRRAKDDPEGEDLFGPVVPLGRRDLPVFPVEVLPPWIANHVTAVARQLQVPVDLPAMVALGLLAVAMCKAARVYLWDGWEEPLTLFVVIIAGPSVGKSPTFKAMGRPFEAFEAWVQMLWSKRIARLELQLAEVQQQIEETKARIKEALKEKNETALAELREQHVGLEREKRALERYIRAEGPQLFVVDSSPQELARLMAENACRMSVFSGEGGSAFDILSASGRGGQKTPFGPWLTGWSGDRLKVNRVGEGGKRRAEDVEDGLLAPVLAVQPDVLTDIANVRGTIGQGFVARWLYSKPKDRVGYRLASGGPPDEQAARIYRSRLRHLLEVGYKPLIEEFQQEKLVLRKDEEELIDDDERRHAPEELVLSCDEGAVQVLQPFFAEVEREFREDGKLGLTTPAKEWGAKLRSNVFRISALLQIADRADNTDPREGKVSEDVARRAVVLGRYLIEHGLALLGILEAGPVIKDAQRIADWIISRKLERFEAWRPHKNLREFNGDTMRVKAALLRLQDCGYLHEVKRRRATWYLVRPGLEQALKEAQDRVAPAANDEPAPQASAERRKDGTSDSAVEPGASAPPAPAICDSAAGEEGPSLRQAPERTCPQCGQPTAEGMDLCEPCKQAEKEVGEG